MATPKRRMGRIFRRDGRTLIVAMDHGSQGPVKGLEKPRYILEQVVEAGVDAVLTSFGIATSHADLLVHCGLILRIDGGSGFDGENPTVWQRYPVSDAVSIGADGVGCMGLIGWPSEAQNLQYITRLTSECLHTGMPLMVEAVPLSDVRPGPDLAGGIAKCARISAEMGADFVKTRYTGDIDSFRALRESTFVPIVILGGPKMDSDEGLLTVVRDTLIAGASGVAFGRNIWQHPAPGKLVRALAAVIHDEATPEQAAKLLR